MLKCGIKDLSIPRQAVRCDACVKGKIHKLGHSQTSTGVWDVYAPGEYLITDLQGPYTRTLKGHRYSQIFVDVGSRRIWTVLLTDKTGAEAAVRDVLAKCRARSGKRVKYLQTDGDGIFRRESWQRLRQEERFVHVRTAAYDH